MQRISRHHMFLNIARCITARSTCYRLNVGAILVQQNNIVSMGYNGAPKGEPHCEGNGCPLTQSGGCTRAVHAEINALKRLPTHFKQITMYVTDSPCPACAHKIIMDARIDRIFYEREYRLKEPIEDLINADIYVFRITPGGHTLYVKSGCLVNANELP